MFAVMDLRLVLGLFLFVCSLLNFVLAKDASSLLSEQKFRLFGGSDRNVKFYLYSRNSLTSPEIFQRFVRRRSLFSSFDTKKPIKVVIHGWKGSNEKRFCTMLREGLLKHNDLNVITVDWSENGSKNWLYPVSRGKVPEVAKIVADFLDQLSQNFGVNLENIHVVGHSLGAHIAGIAGRMVQSGRIGRITGLDPAGPSFSVNKPDERLDTRSANFVDVIHTCANALGLTEPIGHADFYPNDGKFIQPGCGMDLTGSCSHRRGYFLYLESLENPKAFPAISCPSWDNFENNKDSCDTQRIVYMGEGLENSTRGVFYLRTNKDSPFGLGEV